MNFNLFSSDSFLYPLRWFIIAALAGGAYMTYADLSGGRMLVFPQQQQWSSSRAGYHK